MAEEKLIGTQPHQVPRNADLGDLAYQNGDGANINSLTIGNLRDNPTWTHDMVPSRPNVLLDFKNSETIHPSIRWRRNSRAWHFDKTGRMVEAMPNTARIDYDPHTGECLGLLNEPPGTNRILYSWRANQWVDNQGAKVDTTITTTAPDGRGFTYLVREQATNARQSVSTYTSSNQTSGQKNVWTFWLKPYASSGTPRRYYYVELAYQGAQYSGFYIDLNNGNPYPSSGAGIFRWYDFEYFPDTGWYRFRFGTTASNSGTTYFYITERDDAGNLVFTGDTTKGFFLWGLDLRFNETNWTSYIETDGSEVTRLGDYGTISLAELGVDSYGNQKPLTLFAQAAATNVFEAAAEQTASVGGLAGFMSLTQGSEGRIQLRSNHSTDESSVQFIMSNSAASSTLVNIVDTNETFARGETFKAAVTIADSDIALYTTRDMKDITPIGTETAGDDIPVFYDSQGRPHYFVIGWAASNFGYFNGHIERISLWSRRLPNNVLSKLVEI